MQFGRKPVNLPRPPKKSCKIITKKVGNRLEKSIEGQCTPQELKTLGMLDKSDPED